MRFFNDSQIFRLNQLIDSGYIRWQKHPTEDLYIYNYTNDCQFARNWNDITLYTRGLILDGNYNLVSRPFKKFFNLSELESEYTPNIELTNNYILQDKMDGFMGISYIKSGNILKIASRGSFDSEQAEKANQILYNKYSEDARNWILKNPHLTFLFEIIYPKREQNVNLVVDYGETRDLFLTAVIDDYSGKDLLINKEIEPPFPQVKEFDIKHDRLSDLVSLNWENAEGLVAKFNNHEYVKIKFEEYVRQFNLLKIGTYKQIIDNYLFGDIQDVMKRLDDLDAHNQTYIKQLIDEVDQEYRKLINDAEAKYQLIIQKYNQLYNDNLSEHDKKKLFASLVFENVDNKIEQAYAFNITKSNFENKIKQPIYKHLRKKFKDDGNTTSPIS